MVEMGAWRRRGGETTRRTMLRHAEGARGGGRDRERRRELGSGEWNKEGRRGWRGDRQHLDGVWHRWQ